MSKDDDDGGDDQFFSRFGNPEEPDGSIQGMIEQLPLSALESPRRSTVPLLELWKSGRWRRRFVGELGGSSVLGGQATFEFQVRSKCNRCDSTPRGGKDSFTDLMLELPDSVQAIEAKYKEDLYESVDRWLQRGRDRSNRVAVLRHWLHVIQERTQAARSPADVGALVYQMIHRTASACSHARDRGKQPHVVHLLFGASPAKAAKYAKAVRKVKDALDPEGRIIFRLVLVGVEEAPEVAELYELHRKKAPGVAEEVKGALLSKRRLYRFVSISSEEPT